MSKKQKKVFYRIIVAFCIFITLVIVEYVGVFQKLDNDLLLFICFLLPYFIVGYDVILDAFRNVGRGQFLDENFLMMIATFGAFAISEYFEAIAVMLFYQIGELFQSYALGKSRQSISDLMSICPEYANIEVDGNIEKVDPEEVSVNDIIVIKPGEKIPLDGVVIEGSSFIDTSALTGESLPREIHEKDEIISGCLNRNGTLKLRVTKAFEDSTVSKILELVENASLKKAKMENFITRFARYYTPFVTFSALILAIFPPIIFHDPWLLWLERACTFLVISCPCALVISVPLGFFGGIGAASRNGILIKGSNYLELLTQVDTVVFDKTGTLTNGIFEVTEIVTNDVSKKEVLEKTALLEAYSNHPIAESICKAYGHIKDCELDLSRVDKLQELSGYGVCGEIDGQYAIVGNYQLMKKYDISCEEYLGSGTVVYTALEGKFLGYVVISDKIKEDVKADLETLKQNGIMKTIMLTGDRKEVALEVAKQCAMDAVYYELLPQDKVQKVEEIMQHEKKQGKVAFVGDGINDAPVLARVDLGFAMGSMGSDAAIEAADVIIMDDDIRKISKAISIARKTVNIVKQNIFFAIGIKFAFLILATFGIVSMWGAVFADVGVAVLAILNSMRMLNK